MKYRERILQAYDKDNARLISYSAILLQKLVLILDIPNANPSPNPSSLEKCVQFSTALSPASSVSCIR